MAVNIYNQVPFNAYTPKSFQEMLAPVMYASEQEEKLQEQYAQTGSTIDKATAYLNPELDSCEIRSALESEDYGFLVLHMYLFS